MHGILQTQHQHFNPIPPYFIASNAELIVVEPVLDGLPCCGFDRSVATGKELPYRPLVAG